MTAALLRCPGRGLGPAPLVAALLGLLMSACTTPPGVQPPPSAPAAKPEPRAGERPPSPGSLSAVDQFEQTQRTAAEIAARKGRWAEAVWAWDVVLALKPNDADALAARMKAEAGAQAAVAERLPRAAQARSRGDVEQASRLYLEVLALNPSHAEAADALRAMERDRARRQAVGPFARSMVPAQPSRTPAAQAGGTRVDLEHASLLADQGEIDAAIAMLQPAPGARRFDAEARALLADLYVRQADKLAPTDRAGAIHALRQSLLAVPGHAVATQKLRQLQAAGSAPGNSARPTSLSRPSPGPSSGR